MRLKPFVSFLVIISFLSLSLFTTDTYADSRELNSIAGFIKQRNAHWKASETSVSKLKAERRKKRLGAHIPPTTGRENILMTTSAAVPAQLDWRNYNGKSYVTPVKEQGECSACWAFATAGALESNVMIANNTPGVALDLSEQTLNSCSGAGSCSGGYIDAAANYVRDFGLPQETCYPYTAADSFCVGACSEWLTSAYRIPGWYKANPTVASIKYALYNYGPLVALMTAYTDFYYYKSGVYSQSWGSLEGYHATLIVGYNDAEQYFIVKSSWGEDWGESGYARIAYSEVGSNVQFGSWTIAYTTAIPANFPIVDNIPRDPNNPNTSNPQNPEQAQLSTLAGTIKDASGNTVSGAEVVVGKYRVVSGAVGQYIFSALPAGEYVATVSKAGYGTVSENLSVSANVTVSKNFVMSATDQTGDNGSNPNDDGSGQDNLPTGNSEGGYGPGWHSVISKDLTARELKTYMAERRKKILAAKAAGAPLAGAAADINSELQELARGLRNNPKLIYDYVHNNIDYAPYYGSRKGAYQTYLDGSGNDFDQASLMIALLRAAGYTAQYVYGQMTIPGTQMANWFGVDMTATTIHNVLHTTGIIHSTPLSSGQTTLDRVWVKATINGADYLFDPAFKSYTYQSKIDLGTAMGYNQSALLSAAGGTLGTSGYSIQNMSEANFKSQLTTYAGNLASYIRNQNPNAELNEIIGGRKIDQTYMTTYQTTLPFSPVVASDWPKDDIPVEMTSILSVGICRSVDSTSGWQCIAANSEIFTTINTSDLGGKRLTLTFDNGNIPQLCQEGTTCLSGLSSPPTGMYLTIKIDHPSTSFDQTVRYYVQRGTDYSYKYAIVYNLGGVSDSLLSKRQQKLDAYRAQGLADTSEAVRGETLNIMGQTWLKEVAMSNKFLSSMAETVGLLHHNVGLMCQETGYYIDVKAGLFGSTSKHYPATDNYGHFLNSALLGSAYEHGMLEQLMGSDKPAASTIKLLQLANATGEKVFYVNSTSKDAILGTADDCSDAQLINYTCSEIKSFRTNAASTYRTYILPGNGQLVLNQWKGKGYIDKYSTSSMGMIIGGNYYGGYGSYKGYVSPPVVSTRTTVNNYAARISSNIYCQFNNLKTHTCGDPVEMAGGAFVENFTDLSMGGGEPLGVTFARSYNSGKNTVQRNLGYGWTHNYDIYLTPSSHSDPVFGNRQPIEAAGLIAAVYASLDLLRTQDNIQSWMTAVLATKWAVDQMIDNAMTVSMGNKSMEYVKLPDGTYSAPPGITTGLVNNAGVYSLKDRSGITMTFNTDKRISSITDMDGNAMSFTYTGSNLTSVKDAFNRTLTLNYSDSKITSVADTAGRSVSYSIDANTNLTGYTDPEGKPWSYGYDSSHRMTTVKNPLNITKTTNTYDSLGRIMTQTMPIQGGATATDSYYFSGYRSQRVDSSGNAYTFYFDAKGREFADEDPLGNKVTKVYDGQDHVIQVTDPRNQITAYLYDGNQNLKRVTNALGYYVENTYGTAYPYLLTSTADPLGHGKYFTYSSSYHVISVVDALGNSTGSTYYNNGLLKTVTDGRNTTSTLTYDAYGNPYTSKTAAHPAITYGYDSIGRITSLTDQVGSTTTFTYNARGLLTTKTDPLSKVTVFSYDDNGRMSTRTDRKGHVITYAYTPSDKIDTMTYPDSSQVRYTYNNLDQLTAMQDAIGTASYTYDAAGRLISMTDSNGVTIGYTYDAVGNLTTLTYPGNKTVSYTYDALNRIKTVNIDWLGQTATYADYDAAGRLPSYANFNGTVTSFGYDNADRLTSIGNQKSDASVISNYAFALDGNGNRTQTVQNEPYAHDVSDSTVAYAYNAKRNRLTAAGSTTYTYDDEGQLATVVGTPYTFDYEHRLKTIGSAIQFYYDGAGNRLKAIRSGVETRYIYDAAGRLLAEADASNTITKYYIYGNGLLATVTPAGQVYCYHFNGVGSTIAITDSTQAVVNKYAYDPFGNVASQSEAITQPFKYVGQAGVMTEANGFYYMKARYYDPTVGRFISEDPIGFDGGDVNLMAYVGGNPVNFIDPEGLQAGFIVNQTTKIVTKPLFKNFEESGSRIIRTGLGFAASGILVGAAAGSPGGITSGPAAIAGGFTGFAAGLLVGVAKEIARPAVGKVKREAQVGAEQMYFKTYNDLVAPAYDTTGRGMGWCGY